MPEDKPTAESSRVPSGRLNRFLQLGAAASKMAAGGLVESARRIGKKAQDGADHLPHALLTAKNATILAKRLARLRGAAMKVGQMLSMEGDGALPPEFAQALEILRSSAHRMPRQQVEQVFQSQLGPDYLDCFGSLEIEPLKAASIGQVHRGTTLDGRAIVIKIQYPGVAASIDSDIDNLRSLLAMARLLPGEMDVDEFAVEIKSELHREVDYGRELRQQAAYRAGLSGADQFLVPEPIPELSTDRLLAMEYAPGRELLDWAKGATQDERDRAGRLLIELLLREFFEMRLMQTDPNPANYLYDEQGERIVLLDFGATRSVSPEVGSLYRKAVLAVALSDEGLVRQVIEQLGVVAEPESHAVDHMVDIALCSAQVFEDRVFDFGNSDLAEVLNEKGRKMASFRKELRPPAPEYIFFQRKLGGTFLLCSNLGARVHCRQLLKQFGLVD